MLGKKVGGKKLGKKVGEFPKKIRWISKKKLA